MAGKKELGRLLVVAIGLSGAIALASPNDFHLIDLGNPTPGAAMYSTAADGNFQAFASELGAALTSSTLTGTHTLGYNGFAVNAELNVVNFKKGFIMPTERPFSGPLLLPSIHFRKGLPWSLELGAKITWLDKSKMAAGTFEARWALTEGFKKLPEVTLRIYGTKLFNTPDFDLWSAGTDLSVGKRFAIGGMVTLAPYIGWNLGWTHATSNRVDFAPSRSEATFDATPASQLLDTSAFAPVTAAHNHHNRFYLGARFVGGIVSLAAEVSITGLGSIDQPDPSIPGSTQRDLPSIFAFSTTLGLDF